MDSDANNSKMFRKRQNHPIPKVPVYSNENPLILYSSLQNHVIVCTFESGFRGAHDVMPVGVQDVCEFTSQHLVEIKAHPLTRQRLGRSILCEEWRHEHIAGMP